MVTASASALLDVAQAALHAREGHHGGVRLQEALERAAIALALREDLLASDNIE